MKITPINKPSELKAYSSQAKKDKPAFNPNAYTGDKVELSPQAKEINKHRAELKTLPQTREEKVQDLKQRINNGTYKPSAEKIAEGIINERRLDEFV